MRRPRHTWLAIAISAVLLSCMAYDAVAGEGMAVLKGVKAKGEVFEGTEILDPFSGNTYRVKLTLKEHGQKMDVRGFVGLSLFGRTQVWERVE